MKILLLCSRFNGLTQRVWIELRRRRARRQHGRPRSTTTRVRAAVAAVDPDLILCPFLRERVPDDVWSSRPTVIIHPGSMGDHGPSSLDWAIAEGEREWGVTALSAIEEMDAGPIWATRNFPMPADPPRKSALYAGLVTDAAVELAREVVAKAADAGFQPRPLDYDRPGRPRPAAARP